MFSFEDINNTNWLISCKARLNTGLMELTYEYGPRHLADRGQATRRPHGQHFGAHTCAEAVGHVVRSDAARQHESHQEAQHHQPHELTTVRLHHDSAAHRAMYLGLFFAAWTASLPAHCESMAALHFCNTSRPIRSQPT